MYYMFYIIFYIYFLFMLCCHGVRYSHRMSKICHDVILQCSVQNDYIVSFYPGISVSGFEGHLQIFQVSEW